MKLRRAKPLDANQIARICQSVTHSLMVVITRVSHLFAVYSHELNLVNPGWISECVNC